MLKTIVKEERTKRGWSQEEMAQKIGITQRVISNIETGRNEPDIKTIKEYCRIFNLSADYILGLPKGLDYPEE